MPPVTALEKFEAAIPFRQEVRLPMVADSSTAVGINIDTGLSAGQEMGWTIYGMRWHFEDIATPFTRHGIANTFTADAIANLQLCRGEKPGALVILRGGDADLMIDDVVKVVKATQVGGMLESWPRTVRKSVVTQLPDLYLMFETDVDIAEISVAGIQIYAEILYHPVKGPKIRPERQ